MGIEVYSTHSLGIGGVIRQNVEDFIVEEVLVDGSKATVAESVESTALGSNNIKNRYLLCVLVKRSWDTLAAVKAVADQLAISMGRIDIAGLKDAKAVAAMHITIEGVSPEMVQKVKVKDLELRSVGYVRNKLSAYYLLGNAFRISIGSISNSKQTVSKRITRILEELELVGGVPNFFGHQRFGTTRSVTHLVGKAIVKGDFRKAAMLFLAKPGLHEHSASRQARKELQKTQDFRQALQGFPKQLRYERLMLKRLAEEPDDYVGAFKRLPMKLQELFVQAYQSYLFNKFLSRRIANELKLNRAEVGDYVVRVQRSGLPMIAMQKTVTAATLAEINNAIVAGKMRVALPLTGFRQKISGGTQGEIEKQILADERLNPESFKINAMPMLTTRGELRTAITPLNDFSLNGVFRDLTNPSRNKANIGFTLHRGSYATIVLRELMKTRNPIVAGF